MKTSMCFKCFIFILNIFLDYFHVLNIAFVIILLILFLLLLLLLQLSFCYYIVQNISNTPSHPHPFIKAADLFSKLMAIGDLKNFARKGGLFSLEKGGCHIISRFFWRFFTMLNRKKS